MASPYDWATTKKLVERAGNHVLADLKNGFPRGSFFGKNTKHLVMTHCGVLHAYPAYRINARVETPRSSLSPLRLHTQTKVVTRPVIELGGFRQDFTEGGRPHLNDVKVYMHDFADLVMESLKRVPGESYRFAYPEVSEAPYRLYLPISFLEQAFGAELPASELVS